MRQHVEGDLLRIHLAGGRSAIEQISSLFGELFDSQLAGTRNCLISRHVDAFYADFVVNWLQRHQHLNSGTIRIGDDVAIGIVGNFLRVDFRNHKRNIVLVAEVGRVVDHATPGSPGLFRVLCGHAAAGREQADLRF